MTLDDLIIAALTLDGDTNCTFGPGKRDGLLSISADLNGGLLLTVGAQLIDTNGLVRRLKMARGQSYTHPEDITDEQIEARRAAGEGQRAITITGDSPVLAVHVDDGHRVVEVTGIVYDPDLKLNRILTNAPLV